MMPTMRPASRTPAIASKPASSATGSAARPISEARKLSDLPLRKMTAPSVESSDPRIQANAIDRLTEIPIDSAT
jgi:hypothetical protein